MSKRTILQSFLSPGIPFFIFAAAFFAVDISQKALGEAQWLEKLTEFAYIGIWPALVIVFVCFLETIFVVSFYFPGSLAILLFATAFRGSISGISFLLVCYWIALVLGVLFNYFLGRYYQNIVRKMGHRNTWKSANNVFQKYGHIAVACFSFHPNYIGTLFLVFGLTGFRPKLEIFTFLVSMVLSSILFLTVLEKITLTDTKSGFLFSAAQFSIFLIGIGLLICVWRFRRR